MNDYIKKLEEQNEELRQKLSSKEITIEKMHTPLFIYAASLPHWFDHTPTYTTKNGTLKQDETIHMYGTEAYVIGWLEQKGDMWIYRIAYDCIGKHRDQVNCFCFSSKEKAKEHLVCEYNHTMCHKVLSTNVEKANEFIQDTIK